MGPVLIPGILLIAFFSLAWFGRIILWIGSFMVLCVAMATIYWFAKTYDK